MDSEPPQRSYHNTSSNQYSCLSLLRTRERERETGLCERQEPSLFSSTMRTLVVFVVLLAAGQASPPAADAWRQLIAPCETEFFTQVYGQRPARWAAPASSATFHLQLQSETSLSRVMEIFWHDNALTRGLLVWMLPICIEGDRRKTQRSADIGNRAVGRWRTMGRGVRRPKVLFHE